MEEQRTRARAAWAGSGDLATDTVWYAVRDRVGATEFLGYEADHAEGVVTALLSADAEIQALPTGSRGRVVVNQTPFYGESGGQVGDTGKISGPGFSARVVDTEKKLGDVFVHHVEVEEGTLRVGDPIELAVDRARRTAVRGHHSATHILHEALRRVLGDHVAQKGRWSPPIAFASTSAIPRR
jgi:alanyl-tRNA synthetase